LEGLILPARQAPARRTKRRPVLRSFSNMMVSGRKAALLAVVAAGIAAGGCSKTQDIQGYLVDETLVAAVQPGIDNKDSVQNTLGRPTFTGTVRPERLVLCLPPNQEFAFNFPRVNQQTVLHVRFDAAGNVASVERKGLEQVVSIDPMNDKTPTLGREKSIWDELFGNIGAVGRPASRAPAVPTRRIDISSPSKMGRGTPRSGVEG
jgi:outer membrane protein assembly factor BamE (lipoprotein component of BamABCDE complex)